MNKIWIKLLRDLPAQKQKAGAILEVDEAIGRAYIEAGAAEEHAQAQDALEATAAAEVQRELAAARQEFNQALTGLRDEFRSAAAALRPQVGHIEHGESEADKFLAHGGGFRNLGHFAHDIVRGLNPGGPDRDSVQRLAKYQDTVTEVLRGTPTGMSEQSDADGALLVPPTFSNTIWERMMQPERLIARLNPIPISGNSIVLKARNDKSRVDGQRGGGILGYWQGEADQFQKSKTTFRDLELKLKKLTALVYVTNELLADGSGLQADLERKVPDEFDFQVNRALVSVAGNGVGMPLSIMNSKARVTVAKESAQDPATIVYLNVVKMWNRLHAMSRPRAVWLINQEIEPQLETMYLATGTTGVPVYTPAGGGADDSGLARLKGRPVIPVEQCEALGTEGDIILADFTNYAAIIKGGVQSNVSIHLRFDYDETVFKWTLRMDAQPYEEAPLTPYKGTSGNTYSSFVSLQTRS